jgi:hypothetical protein
MAISVDSTQATHVAQQQEVIVFGERFTQPAREDQWATLEPVNDAGEYIEDLYTGGVKSVSATRLYDLVVRVLATDPWLRDVWPKAKAAQENGEKVRALFNDKNKDRPITAQSDDVVIPKMVPLALYNKVGVVELRFRGLFNVLNTVSGFPS